MLKQLPNILTLGRFVLTVIFLVMVFYAPAKYDQGELPFPDLLDWAFIIFVIAGLTDMVDGTIARKMGVASKFGRMMDPLADKVLVCGAFICFAIVGWPKLFDLDSISLSVIHWSVAAIIILREAYVTIIRHMAEAKGINFAATASGKVKMFLQSFAIGTIVIKKAHVQDELWGSCFTSTVLILTVIVTVTSGLRATQRKSLKEEVNP